MGEKIFDVITPKTLKFLFKYSFANKDPSWPVIPNIKIVFFADF